MITDGRRVPPEQQVVAAARELHRRGLTVSSLGNVSVRCGDRLWITPTRVRAADLTPDRVVVVGLDGARGAGGAPSRELAMHLEIYRCFPEAAAIVHAHSPWAVAWSYTRRDLALSTEELRYHGFSRISCAPEAEAGSKALGAAAATALRDTPVALLGGHGVVARGAAADDALELCALAEQQAHVQWLLRDSTLRSAGARGPSRFPRRARRDRGMR
jgi:L-ribulose-5-phosphate 4-epimerase